MVPEGLQEEAALSASVPVAKRNPEAEAEVAESTEVAVGGSTGFNWADASEDATVPTTDFAEVGGAASSALGDETAEDFDILKFDALSLLDPVKPEEVTAEELFEALEADPAGEPVEQPTASDQIEADNNLEVENPDNQTPKEEPDFNNPDLQETSAEVADAAADPIVGSSPTLQEVHDPNSIEAPVYVTYPAEEAERTKSHRLQHPRFLSRKGLPQAPQHLGTFRQGIRHLDHPDHPAYVVPKVVRKLRPSV